MKDLLNDSPIFLNFEEEKQDINDLKKNEDKLNKEKKISELNLGSEYFDINDENENEHENKYTEDKIISSSITSGEEENFNFYNVPKTNIINYMTPIKVNVDKSNKNKKKDEMKIKNKTNNDNDISNDLFSISNSSIEDKKVMISELDIELSNSSRKNFLTEFKMNRNDINIIKKRENEFKKQIEQNLKKFLESNRERENENLKKDNKIKKKLDKNKLNIKMRLKKHSQNINYCFTDISHKIDKLKKNSISNNININSNNLGSFILMKNRYIGNKINNNNSFKTRTINTNKNNLNKKLNEFVKIKLDKKIKNSNKQNEFKSKIFYLQNKRLNNKNLKTNELSDYLNSQRSNNNTYANTINTSNYNKNNRKEYFSISEKKRYIQHHLDRQNKKDYTSIIKKTESNLNEKNIIIQNFNCIDYNNINININNNNIIKTHKLSHRRNIDKNNNIFNSKTKKNFSSIQNNIFFKKEKPKKIDFFYKSYIKNFYKNNGLDKYQRKGNEKKLTFLDNNIDIRNKTFNYYINKKNENLKIKEKNKNINNNKILHNKLNIQSKNIEIKKKYFNTIVTDSMRIIKQKTFKNPNKSSLAKFLMSNKY